LFLLISTVLLVGAAFLLATLSNVSGLDHTLMYFDEDLSESVIGWMIAIPVLVVAAVVTVVALAFAGAVVALVLAVAVLMALVVAAFALVFALIPVAAFLAVPAAMIWAIVKISRRNAAAAVRAATA
jgi:hypothetical protein